MHKYTIVLTVLLVGCGSLPYTSQSAPQMDSIVTTPAGEMRVRWQLTRPGGVFGGYAGHALWNPLLQVCEIYLDPSRLKNPPHTIAHELAHCFQLRYGLPGYYRPELGTYYKDAWNGTMEGFAESYARKFSRECGDTMALFGIPWDGFNTPASCSVLPNPRSITGKE